MSDEPSNPEKALVRVDAATPAPVGQSALQRLGLGKESSKAAPYLRAILAGLQEAGSEQIRQIPILGPLLSGAGAALLQLSSEEDDAKLEANTVSRLFLCLSSDIIHYRLAARGNPCVRPTAQERTPAHGV